MNNGGDKLRWGEGNRFKVPNSDLFRLVEEESGHATEPLDQSEYEVMKEVSPLPIKQIVLKLPLI